MLKYALPASLLLSVSAFAQTHVVTSIKPVSMVVSAIGGDQVKIEQLVNNQASPHDFAMRPSDLRKLDQADLVVWVGENLETFLEKPLANLSGKKDIEWMALSGTYLRQFSETADEHHHDEHEEHGDHDGHDHDEHHEEHGDHDGHDHDEHHEEHGDHDGHDHDEHHEEHEGHDEHGHEGHHHTGTDPHVWLDPVNAKVLAHEVMEKLSALDPAHKQAFSDNYNTFVRMLDVADKKVRAELEPVKDVPYFVFHEAYGYFENHYKLNNKGAITLSPERKPGAKTVADIRTQIEQHNVACVFSEPQFSPAIVDTLIEGTEVKTAVLDPLGVSLKLSSNSYPAFLEALAGQYAACLK
ncbi:zinc ABC transporter substrate-binding protein ZnuA [Marinomonas fungiae]|uniref:High-affinity zinc uptake system protein ZnuA n=1 Tax=Marinomonas fungiae TaxID=1137284 RepID=A0A0K6INY2_9GAMM|nr:zinc ABC transporter substrate-binding protein ZnuA [Marinomonas fungiae]CUB04808.1 ABC-type Zn2+ transport system, periplasmic component/surface adhesin [Marinomonas fungiae]